MFGPVGFAGGPGRARAGGRSGPPRPTGRGGPHHERPGISAKECKTDRKILCKPHVKQLLSNPRVIRASCLTAERVPRGSASRQPDGLVGLVVLSVSLFETRGDLDRLCRPPSFLWLFFGRKCLCDPCAIHVRSTSDPSAIQVLFVRSWCGDSQFLHAILRDHLPLL